MSSLASKPLILNWSPASVPPSPMAMVMPGTLRNASSSVVVPCCFMVAASTTSTVWGVSCRLVDGIAATGGAWFSALESASSWTETGPNWSGWAFADAHSASDASMVSDAPDEARNMNGKADTAQDPFDRYSD